ncbi:MAG: hypothetical protein ACM31C_09495 [Acidobacteriota bacterium]
MLLIAACADFRAYTPPAPLVSPGPATAQGEQCLPPDEKLVDFEEAREHAALDAELRAHGSMLIPARVFDERDDRDEHPLGTVFRGPAGERLLVVGDTEGCDPHIPLIGIDASRAVFVVRPVPRPKTKRTIQLCQPICGGCGAHMPVAVVAEIPEGGHFVPERDVTFPIDVQVELVAGQGHCEPPP